MVNIKNLHIESFHSGLREEIQALVALGVSNNPFAEGMHGVLKSQGLVFSYRNGRTVVRRYRRPRDPKSEFQLPVRGRFGEGNRLWSAITEEERAAWQEYALRHRLYRGKWRGQSGQRTFVRVAGMRVALGEAVRGEAPVTPPPGAPVRITQEAATASDELVFRIEHGLAGKQYQDLSGWRVKVEMTPATVRATRKPRENELVWACGVRAESCPQLLANGEVYRLKGVRFRVMPGERFGVRVSIVTPEGVCGKELIGDFIRMDFKEPEVTAEEILLGIEQITAKAQEPQKGTKDTKDTKDTTKPRLGEPQKSAKGSKGQIQRLKQRQGQGQGPSTTEDTEYTENAGNYGNYENHRERPGLLSHKGPDAATPQPKALPVATAVASQNVRSFRRIGAIVAHRTQRKTLGEREAWLSPSNCIFSRGDAEDCKD